MVRKFDSGQTRTALPPERQKKPGFPGFFTAHAKRSVDRLDGYCLVTLGAGRYFEGDLLAFFERFEPVAADGREVGKKVFAAIFGGDKAKTFGIIEPLNCTGSHVSILPEKINWAKRPIKHCERFKRRETTTWRVPTCGYNGPTITA
jgi:hypothetical protein